MGQNGRPVSQSLHSVWFVGGISSADPTQIHPQRIGWFVSLSKSGLSHLKRRRIPYGEENFIFSCNGRLSAMYSLAEKLPLMPGTDSTNIKWLSRGGQSKITTIQKWPVRARIKYYHETKKHKVHLCVEEDGETENGFQALRACIKKWKWICTEETEDCAPIVSSFSWLRLPVSVVF